MLVHRGVTLPLIDQPVADAELKAQFLHIPIIGIEMLMMHHARGDVHGIALIPVVAPAADLGIARRTSEMAGHGAFRQTVVYSSGGCLAVYAVGTLALMVVFGDEGLNVTRLHQESQAAIERINSILTAA